MLVEVRVCELRLDSDNKIGLVVLKETDGDRLLRIYIGEAEALAIAYHLESLSVARPLTHDLLCSVLQGLGGLDARPSDSIALALRASADIFVEERLLDAATLEFSQDLDFSPAKDAAETTFGEATFDVQITSAEDLEERLRRLNPEDFGRFKP